MTEVDVLVTDVGDQSIDDDAADEVVADADGSSSVGHGTVASGAASGSSGSAAESVPMQVYLGGAFLPSFHSLGPLCRGIDRFLFLAGGVG